MTTSTNFKAGDTVKILRKATTHENGWKNSWEPEMDEVVGKTGTITRLNRLEEYKDVQVRVGGVTGILDDRGTYGYPSFVLEVVPTPINPGQFLRNCSTPVYGLGDRVQIVYGYGWNGPATVTKVPDAENSRDYYEVKTDDCRTGGFYAKDLKPFAEQNLKPLVPFAEQKPVGVALRQEGIGAVSAHSKVFGIAKAAAIEAGKEHKFVHIEHVQEKLRLQGYKPSDLGNAAGGVFRSKLWKDTGKTTLSNRSTSRARKITVWEYIGEGQQRPHAALIESHAEPKKYIIEYRSKFRPLDLPEWERSGNISTDGKYLYNFSYTDVRKANDEAVRQMNNMGSGYEYRVTEVV